MAQGYRVIFESYDLDNPAFALNKTTVCEGLIDKPTSLIGLSMGLDKQIDLIKATQNCVLQEKWVSRNSCDFMQTPDIP